MFNRLKRRFCFIFKEQYKKYLSRLRVNHNRLVFTSHPCFADNSKALYHYFLTQNNDYEYIWLIEDESIIPKGKNKNTTFVKSYSPIDGKPTAKAMKALATARVCFSTHGRPQTGVPKKEGQFYVNLWHGCGYKNAQIQVRDNEDLALVPGNIYVPIKTKLWSSKPGVVQPLGYPRYDLFFDTHKKGTDLWNAVLGIKPTPKIVIWTPTFRQSTRGTYLEEQMCSETGLPLAKTMEDLIKCNEVCKENHITLVVKRHPSQKKYPCEKEHLSNILFISNNDLTIAKTDLYELLPYTCGMISDYSSVAIDYLLLDKPIGYALNDYDEYMDKRGFVFENPLEYMPGHHIYSMDDLTAFLYDVANGTDLYREARKSILPIVHNPTKEYCKRLVDELNKRGIL